MQLWMRLISYRPILHCDSVIWISLIRLFDLFLINKSNKYILKEIMLNWFFFKQVRVWIMQGDGNYSWMCLLYRDLSCWQYKRFLRHKMHNSSSNFYRQWVLEVTYLTMSNQGDHLIIMNLSISKYLPY